MNDIKIYTGSINSQKIKFPLHFHELVRSPRKYDFDIAICFCGKRITTNPAIIPKAICSGCAKDFLLGQYEEKYRAIHLSEWATVIL